MVDSTLSLIDSTWAVIKWLGVALMGIIGYKIKRTDKAIDSHSEAINDLKENSIPKDVFNNTLQALRSDIGKIGDKVDHNAELSRTEMREDITGVHERIDRIGK